MSGRGETMDLPTDAAEWLTGSATLENAVGLHARPSVKLTQLAKSHPAVIEFALSLDGPWTDAKSPVKVMRARAGRGATLHVRARGAGAAEAAAAIVALIRRRFDEGDAGAGHA